MKTPLRFVQRVSDHRSEFNRVTDNQRFWDWRWIACTEDALGGFGTTRIRDSDGFPCLDVATDHPDLTRQLVSRLVNQGLIVEVPCPVLQAASVSA